MELDERKLKILRMIIDDYIMTAMPVGSRTISKRADIGLSSATIRNEMSDLEEMGYLDQPHTSAGRIPSDRAYRLYVNSLMKEQTLTAEEVNKVRGYADKRVGEAQEIITRTATLLSAMTNLTSMVMAPELNNVTLRHLQLVPMSDGWAMVIIVTDAGQVHDTMMRVPNGYSQREFSRLSDILTRMLGGKSLANASSLLEEWSLSLGREHRLFFDEIASAVLTNLGQTPKDRFIALGGTNRILSHPEYSDLEKARSMLSLLETKEKVYRLLSRAPTMEFTFTIGAENDMEEVRASSVVTATYKIGGKPVGSFGVIGPTRMDYARVLAVLNYMGQTLSDIFTSMINEGD